MTHPLLALQAADTRADQLAHRRAHLPEQADVDAAGAALSHWEREVALRRSRIDELTAEIEADEARARAIDAHNERLAKQLKTVVAVREAEALQHEMSTLAAERSALDDAELEALEAQSAIDDELRELAGDEDRLRAALRAAEQARDVAAGEIAAQLDQLGGDRDALREAVEPALLARYDSMRPQFGGVAAAALEQRTRCGGCHLDLTAGELDQVRSEAAASAGVVDCPNCGRLLVVE